MIYKILTYLLRFTKFFKYGTPYAYLLRSIENDIITFHLIWYFNNNGAKQTNVLNKNYSDCKYLGNKLSLYYSYKHALKILTINLKFLKIKLIKNDNSKNSKRFL